MFAQQEAALVSAGQLMVAGRPMPYRVRHLPVSSFPELPQAVADELTRRECLIPQTYEARRPENVVQASLERPASHDWAVLCSAHGAVSLLVFFERSPGSPVPLASALETQRLQVRFNGELGFNWGIDPASPERIREAQIGMLPRPRRLDHDALADSVVDRSTLYHYFDQGAWRLLDMPQ